MTRLSISIGLFLSVMGIVSFSIAGFESVTSLSPLFIGAPIAICGVLTEKLPAKRKIFMHIAVGLALVGFLASASRIPKLDEFGSNKSVSIWVMCLLCFILFGAYIQSFLAARMKK